MRLAVIVSATVLLATPAIAQKATKASPLTGLSTFSSDGSKIGNVQCVLMDGSAVKGIVLKAGGFLGFGGKYVVVPEGRFMRAGDNIQLGWTLDDVFKLPERKEKCD